MCPKWITAADLNRWAATPSGKHTLPELLRRLVRATVESDHLKKLDFPSGEETHRPGYDGTTVTTRGNLYVPAGVAFWELGCEVNNVKGKADRDFNNRIKEHEEKLQEGEANDISQAAYIAVTALDYSRTEAWAKDKEAERMFREVRFYDSNRLEHWIWEASGVGLWLAGQILGERSGLWDIETRWKAMQATLKRKLPPRVLLVNRERTASSFEEWLNAPPRELAVKAPSREELVDVFCAWVLSLAAEEQEAILSRAIIVEERDSWMSLIHCPTPLILIAAPQLVEDKELYALAARSHHVLRFAPFTATKGSGAPEMERMRRFDLREALKESEMPEADANRIAAASGGNFTILRRLLASTPEVKTPAWASEGTLAPLLLIGAWKDENLTERAIIEELTGKPYEEVRIALVKRSREADPPIRLVDGTWEFLSPMDAWQFYHEFLNPFMERFVQLAVRVLSEDNPALELEAKDRPMAALKGKVRRFSREIRQGISEVLALGASREAESEVGVQLDFGRRGNEIVGKVIPEGSDWKRWASLGDVLSQLIEAAPLSVIAAMERDMRTEAPALIELMRQEVPGAFGQEFQSGVLWALERAAWSPQLLTRVSLLLGRMDEHDPGGQWTNRARNSLRGVFFSWLPQTMATIGERLDILRLLMERTPVAAWRLLLNLLPAPFESISPDSVPSYRDWAAGWTGQPTTAEYPAYVSALMENAIAMCEADTSRWIALLDHINVVALRFPGEFVKFCSQLEATIARGVSEEVRITLWEKLHLLVLRHTQSRAARWVLHLEQVNKLASLRDSLQPASNLITQAPLFDSESSWFRDEGLEGLTFEQRIERRDMDRRIGVRKVWSEGGFNLLLSLARRVKLTDAVGYAAADELKSEAEAEIIPALLSSEEACLKRFATAYAGKRIWNEGQDWAENLIAPSWSDEQIAIFGQQMAFVPRTWDWIITKGEKIEALYWAGVRSISGSNLDEEFVMKAVRRLQSAGRAWSALELLATRLHMKLTVSDGALCDALEAIVTSPVERDLGVMDVHYAQQAFEVLQKSETTETARVARLEFEFLPILDEHSLLPMTLQRELAANPAFFVECLEALYYRARKSGREDASESDAERRSKVERANRVWHLLHDWQTIPGSNKQEEIDRAALREWVLMARELARDKSLLEHCDSHIGQVFARSGEDKADDAMPVIAIREIIEEIESEGIEAGLEVGLFNLRGTTWRGMFDGGEQERDLAARYECYADSCLRWPRTAGALRRVSEGYLRDAIREDEKAKARE